MLFDQISHTSHFKSLLKNDFYLSLESEDGKRSIQTLLNNSVLLGGKRLRPLLTILFGNLANVPSENLHVLAKSIEYVHAASLAHDDVIDNATTRRGKDSINILGDNKMAILAGDFLLAEVITDLSRLGKIEIVQEMSSIIKRLSLGEWKQHDCLKNKKYQENNFFEIYLNKTSSVMEWCSVAPFLMMDFDDELIQMARNFGENLGISFQLYDDLLDFSQGSQKDQFLDLKNGQLTYITYKYLSQKNLMKNYQNGENVLDLIQFNELSPVIKSVKIQADNYHDKCLSIFNQMIKKLHVLEADKNVTGILYLLEKLKNRTV